MSLEQHVVSLELAKQLKESGYPQKSLFYWREWVADGVSEIKTTDGDEDLNDGLGVVKLYSAPLASELGEQLPDNIDGMDLCSLKESDGRWTIYYQDNESFEQKKFSEFRPRDTEADARAKMWLYLKKENLL